MTATEPHLLLQDTTNPYYPPGSSIPGWTPNEWPLLALLGAFSSACIVLFTATLLLARRVQPSLTRTELLTILWFTLSGTIHIVFEGYFVTHYATLGSNQTILAQMWKEYALSDSRYLTSNGLVLCLETATVLIWGPSCFLVAVLIVLRNPWRFPLQVLVSMAHVYGDALYYATSFFDHAVYGISYSRPEPYYFWFYFVGMNSLWIVIPGGRLKGMGQIMVKSAYNSSSSDMARMLQGSCCACGWRCSSKLEEDDLRGIHSHDHGCDHKLDILKSTSASTDCVTS